MISFFENRKDAWLFEDVLSFIHTHFKTKENFSFRIGDRINNKNENQRAGLVFAYAQYMDYSFAQVKALFAEHDHFAIAMPETRQGRNILEFNKIFYSLLQNGKSENIKINDFPEFFEIPKNALSLRKKSLKMIVAIDLDKGIGKNNELIFSIKKDMQHFTEKTTDGVVIMGSSTYESIPKEFRPLKNRQNIILHRSENPYPDEDVLVAHSISEALSLADDKDVWVIGGASIYRQMISLVSELEITQIIARKDADTFFPEFENDFELISQSEKIFDEKENVEFQFQTWRRK